MLLGVSEIMILRLDWTVVYLSLFVIYNSSLHGIMAGTLVISLMSISCLHPFHSVQNVANWQLCVTVHHKMS